MSSFLNTAFAVVLALGLAKPSSAIADIPPKKATLVDGKYELVQLNILNRHGHRAPNAPYWKLCPNDAYNRKYYKGIANEGLTDVGFKEEYDMGAYLHSKYGWFIGSRYNSKKHFIRAVAEPRTIQSAMIAAQSIFPDGTGPAGMNPERPQYPPVFTDLESHEYLLDDLQCIPEIQRAVGTWVASEGVRIVAEPQNVEALRELVKLCGTTPELFASKRQDIAIKVMIDGVIFNHDMGINVLNGRVKPKLFNTLRNFTNVLLQGKLYGTDHQKTFAAGEFPHDMLRRFKLSIDNPLGKDSTSSLVLGYEQYAKFTYNCAHREELYGVSHFFDMPMHVPGFPETELPAGSSMIFALLRTGDSKENYQYYIKVDLWTPRDGEYTIAPKGCAKPHLCTFEEFQKIYDDRVKRTGTWEKLCNYEIPALDKVF